jgi:hypothetical protein
MTSPFIPARPQRPPETIKALFGNVDAYIRYGPASGIINCELLSSTSTSSFSISASVAATCRIAASTLDFGTSGCSQQPRREHKLSDQLVPTAHPTTLGWTEGSLARSIRHSDV